MWSNHVSVWAVAAQGKSSSSQLWWPHALWQWRYNGFSLPPDLTRLHDQSAMWPYGQVPIKVSYHHAKFVNHKHSGSRDTILLVCHMISQDHVIKGSLIIYVGASHRSPHTAKFGAHRHCGIADIKVLVCYVILHDHVIKRLYDFMVRSLSSKLPSYQV